ncbi:MAG TPA: GDSL-type esterase/lipase family protein [Gaiellaceae bacterium]|nr:GDSL-type esterase/lipase family protein [Gaiellaceae bacterium]
MRTALAACVCVLAAVAATAGPAAGRTASGPAVLDLGDSLSVGTAPYLRLRLRGYRIQAIHDVGLHAYDVADLVTRSRTTLPRVLVVSAGTNDDPRIVSTFWRAVLDVVRAAGARRCVVWPTIVRPAAVGATYDGLNGALRRVAARHRTLVLVDWVGMVARHPEWLSADGVHVSAAGYRARAAAIAAAVTARCPR